MIGPKNRASLWCWRWRVVTGSFRLVMTGKKNTGLQNFSALATEKASKLRLVGGRIRYQGPKDVWMDGDGFIK